MNSLKFSDRHNLGDAEFSSEICSEHLGPYQMLVFGRTIVLLGNSQSGISRIVIRSAST